MLKKINSKILFCKSCNSSFKNKCKCGKFILEKEIIKNIHTKTSNYSKIDKQEAYQSNNFIDLKSNCLKYFLDSEIIVDVGSGDGNSTLLALQNNAKFIYLVDNDERSLIKASKRKISGSICCFTESSQIPLKDNSVDTVFTLFMVEHLTDISYSFFLKEVKRILKLDGKLIIGTDTPVYDKYIRNLEFMIKLKRPRKSGFLDKHNINKNSILHINLKTPLQTTNFLEKNGFFIHGTDLHMIMGRYKLIAFLWDLMPYFIRQYFSTMYFVVSKPL